MKIAVLADGCDLNAQVGHKFNSSQYLIIVDIDSGDFEAVPNPGATGQHGAGIKTVVLVISKDVNAVVTGYCGPIARRQLVASGIEVFSEVSGTVGEIVDKYKKGEFTKGTEATQGNRGKANMVLKDVISPALKRSTNQFVNLIPVLLGVVLLIGLFNAFISEELLSSIFAGNPASDTFLGALFGSILAGNPINSYVIGGEALGYGVSLYAVTALIIAWVSVGVIHLPAEIAAFGKKFALLRNGISFIVAIVISLITVALFNFFT